MKKLFITGEDQIIDLNYIVAIEIVDQPPSYTQVYFHLATGVTIVSRHDNCESASAEKWQAYRQLKGLREPATSSPPPE